jgi:hypothetical protein
MAKQKWETAKDRDESWAKNIPIYKDPVSGKQINSIGDTRPESAVKPSPVGTGLNKPGDSSR